MLKKVKYISIFFILIIFSSCESKTKQLEGKWKGTDISSSFLKRSIEAYPDSLKKVAQLQQDSMIQVRVDSMYIDFEMKNYEGTKGILYTNVYVRKEVVLWRYLEDENKIVLHDPSTEDRYWNILELTENILIVEMSDGQNDWKMYFVRDENKDVKLVQN